MKPRKETDFTRTFVEDGVMVAEPDDEFFGEEWSSPPLEDLCILVSPSTVGAHSRAGAIVGQLAAKGIVHLGIVDGMSAADGTVIGKRGQAMLICFKRPTRILMADGWKRFAPRTACVISSPVHIRTRPETGWAFAYICYGDSLEFPDLTGKSMEFDAAPLVQAIRGLHAEAGVNCGHALLHHWVELIHGYVRIFVQPRHEDERILKAWSRISADLRRDWSVEEMASTAMMCAEHFRRLCLKTYGRSPMMHLSCLRVERAEELLRSTDMKIDSICDEVGYEYRSTFSNIFMKLVGMRPSAYRDAARKLMV